MALRTLRMLAAFSLVAYALPAHAVPVNIRFGGEFTSVTGFSDISVGDRWLLDLSYDWQPPPPFTAGATGYFYRSLSMQVGSLSFDVGDGFFPASITVVNDSSSFFFPDQFTDAINVGGNIGPAFSFPFARVVLPISATCTGAPCGMLHSLELPQTAEEFIAAVDAIAASPSRANFGLSIVVPFDTTPGSPAQALASGALTSWMAVSEPGGLVLWGMGMAALVWLIRRRGVTEASRDPVA
jgi:hypothetical protein